MQTGGAHDAIASVARLRSLPGNHGMGASPGRLIRAFRANPSRRDQAGRAGEDGGLRVSGAEAGERIERGGRMEAAGALGCCDGVTERFGDVVGRRGECGLRRGAGGLRGADDWAIAGATAEIAV